MSSGSEKRRRGNIIRVRVDDQEAAIIAKVADATGQSVAALLRNTLLRIPLPRVRRPKIDENALAQYLSAIAKFSDALRGSEARLGKYDSNINQIAHQLNAGAAPTRIQNLIEMAIQEARHEHEQHAELLRDCQEVRTLGMRALGLEPHRGPGDE